MIIGNSEEGVPMRWFGHIRVLILLAVIREKVVAALSIKKCTYSPL